MNFNRKDIKANARAAISAKYWPIIGYSILAGIIIGAISMVSAIPYVGFLVSVLVVAIIEVGYQWFNFMIYMGEDPDISNLFVGFKDGRFGHVLGGYWYMALFTFLWSLLFVIPGIIKSIAYSMTPYILIDQPEISATDALKKSMEMTKGHKWDIFVMGLSFIGWLFLSAITLGIVGIFYAYPYMSISMAGIYDYLKRESGDYVVDAQPVVDPVAPLAPAYTEAEPVAPAYTEAEPVAPAYTAVEETKTTVEDVEKAVESPFEEE